MAQQRWLFCRKCYADRIFEYVFKSHGWLSGTHTV
jgi:hypothetical protein